MPRFLSAVILGIPLLLVGVGWADERPDYVFCCRSDNDLYRILVAAGRRCSRHDSPGAAVNAAEEGAAVLILADGYPKETTSLTPAILTLASTKKLRLYVEFPGTLPDVEVGKPRTTQWERIVVESEAFVPELDPLRILIAHDCHYVTVAAKSPHLVVAKVAGFDKAVYGLEGTDTHPILLEHPGGDILVATTKLSQFVTARYGPQAAWRSVWSWILQWLRPDGPAERLEWEAPVRPAYTREATLSESVEARAVCRWAAWLRRAHLLRHSSWPPEALDLSLTYNTVRDPPSGEWPRGNGSLGILEGFSSRIRLDGSQPVRYAVRSDCMTEVAMGLAFDARMHASADSATTARRLLDYALVDSPLVGGPRGDPRSPSYGLVGWALDHPGSYWGDDNARVILSTLAASTLLGESRWDETALRCVLANFRTTGTTGYREACVTESALASRGWESYFHAEPVHPSPHFQSWLWACFLWTGDRTGFTPLLDRSERGLQSLMEAYPTRWDWCLQSGSLERARALLPLAWLVRVKDTPEHRSWLERIADDLIALQDESGAIRETLGSAKLVCATNVEYGTRETSLIQSEGDPACDVLYTCNFALIGLHEAAAVTGKADYAKAEDRLAKFLCRIQTRSEAHPELDGIWYRGFDFRRWKYWSSSADWEWGPWCVETGWSQPWIVTTLGLRQRKTSLWELLAKHSIDPDELDRIRREMLPR